MRIFVLELIRLKFGIMETLEITAKQFREKQTSIFEIADAGKQIIIKRGRKQAYILTPVNQDDFALTPEILERIEKSRQQHREGKYTECLTYEDNLKHLESL
jgi:hypothetical protein